MKNERRRVFEVANQLGVSIGDIQHALKVLDLPQRQQGIGTISAQHVEVIRRGLANGLWRPRSRPAASAPPTPPKRQPLMRWVSFTCGCCKDLTRVQVPEDDPIPAICADCREHEVGDSDEAVIRRLQDHVDKVHNQNAAFRAKRDEMQAQRDNAFGTRNTWRRTLVELILNHVPNGEADHGTCLCGESYPCLTRQILPSLNRGIAAEVNRFESMNSRQRDAELSGDRWSGIDPIWYEPMDEDDLDDDLNEDEDDPDAAAS
jgi:hypothetical protein